jgi:uncharacterized delta-60 repeat protein
MIVAALTKGWTAASDRRRLVRALVLAALATALTLPASAPARPGGIDPSFGRSGTAIPRLGASTAGGNGVVVQNDGRILIAGFSDGQCAVTRLRRDGERDWRFGDSGATLFTQPGKSCEAADIALLRRDGRIVVGGTLRQEGAPSRIAVARLLPGGELDPSFGSGGVAVVGPENASLLSLDMNRDGVIALGGLVPRAGREDTLIGRLLPDGTPDPAFSSQGFFDGCNTGHQGGAAVLLLPDGGVAAAVRAPSNLPAPTPMNVMRLTTAGAPDPAFGGTGVVSTPVSAQATVRGSATAIAPGPRGTLNVGGTADGPNHDAAIVFRYLPDGQLDTRFGFRGRARLPVGQNGLAVTALTRAPGGRLLLGGVADPEAFVARVTRGGRADRSFGRRAIVSRRLGRLPRGGRRRLSMVSDLAVQRDGRIVAAGRLVAGVAGQPDALGRSWLSASRLRSR